jgi:hypothetical protein
MSHMPPLCRLQDAPPEERKTGLSIALALEELEAQEADPTRGWEERADQRMKFNEHNPL